jgi:hypothetical protein
MDELMRRLARELGFPPPTGCHTPTSSSQTPSPSTLHLELLLHWSLHCHCYLHQSSLETHAIEDTKDHLLY